MPSSDSVRPRASSLTRAACAGKIRWGDGSCDVRGLGAVGQFQERFFRFSANALVRLQDTGFLLFELVVLQEHRELGGKVAGSTCDASQILC